MGNTAVTGNSGTDHGHHDHSTHKRRKKKTISCCQKKVTVCRTASSPQKPSDHGSGTSGKEAQKENAAPQKGLTHPGDQRHRPNGRCWGLVRQLSVRDMRMQKGLHEKHDHG